MAKADLTQCWIYGGVRYGPGAADLPDDAHKALAAKGAFAVAAAAEAPAVAAPDEAKGKPAAGTAKPKE